MSQLHPPLLGFYFALPSFSLTALAETRSLETNRRAAIGVVLALPKLRVLGVVTLLLTPMPKRFNREHVGSG